MAQGFLISDVINWKGNLMVAELAINVNEISFVLPEAMYIDIRPETALAPTRQRADEQPALTYLAGISKASQRVQWSALCVVAAVLTNNACTPVTLPWHELRRQHLNAVRAWLVEHRAPATGNRILAAVRGTLREAWRLDQMTTEAYMKAIDVKPIRGQAAETAAGRALSHGEKAAILAVCADDPTASGPRNAAIFGLAVFGGLRRAEIAALQVGDYDRERAMVAVLGKGNKRRTVYVAPGVDDALADWLHLRGAADGPLFLAINRGGRILAAGIQPHAIYGIVQRVAERAGVKAFSPHDLRRTFAGDLLDAGADVATVQKLMGHSSVETTGRYDRRGERAKQSAISRLHMPYQKRYSA